jgi:hypothetical protein
MISAPKQDEIMFDPNAVFLEPCVLTTEEGPGDIQDAFILRSGFLVKGMDLHDPGSDMHARYVPRAVEPVGF